MNPKAELIDRFVDKILLGEIEFDQMRKELEAKKMDEKEIREIVRLVDDEVQHAVESGQGALMGAQMQPREFGKTPRHSWLISLFNILTANMFKTEAYEQGFAGHNDRMKSRKRESRFDRWRRR